jgi:hypothetical protein
MKKLLSVLLTGFCLMFFGFAAAQDIVTDVKKLRDTNKSANLDIGQVIERYIQVGATQAQVETDLKAMKFKLYYQPVAPDQTLPMLAVLDQTSLLSFGFGDEIRVIVFFEKGAVKRTSGMLIYRAL